jgi:hypothetical protein
VQRRIGRGDRSVSSGTEWGSRWFGVEEAKVVRCQARVWSGSRTTIFSSLLEGVSQWFVVNEGEKR